MHVWTLDDLVGEYICRNRACIRLCRLFNIITLMIHCLINVIEAMFLPHDCISADRMLFASVINLGLRTRMS